MFVTRVPTVLTLVSFIFTSYIRAIDALDETSDRMQDLDVCPSPAILHIKGIDCFGGGRVVYACVEEGLQLNRVKLAACEFSLIILHTEQYLPLILEKLVQCWKAVPHTVCWKYHTGTFSKDMCFLSSHFLV